MKKLIVALALSCVAMFAEAGAVKWQVYDVDAPDYGVAYLFNASTVAFADVDTIVASIQDGTFATTYAANASKVTDIDEGEIILGNAITGVTGPVNLWMVAVDNDTEPTLAFVGDVISKTLGSSGTQSYTWTYGDNTTEWTAVAPEPTSGMMLLLGMRVLALRRRRA